jgi:pyridoxine 5-phosphate synthase
MVFLGVNIDHVATVRNARGGKEPDPILAALIAEAHGADGITAHLREDRRHIRDDDIHLLKQKIKTRLNLEMAATEEMVTIACQVKPYMCTLVPERREELTTEGGLDVSKHQEHLSQAIRRLHETNIRVSLFVGPDPEQLRASKAVGAKIVELHTGEYAEAFHVEKGKADLALKALLDAGHMCQELGLEVNAGHGLTYDNVRPVLDIPGLVELNIGHNIIAKAIFTGIGPAVAEMKSILTGSAVSHHR